MMCRDFGTAPSPRDERELGVIIVGGGSTEFERLGYGWENNTHDGVNGIAFPVTLL